VLANLGQGSAPHHDRVRPGAEIDGDDHARPSWLRR
jgi:hypothetical protein